MSAEDIGADNFGSWAAAVAAMRLRAVVNLDDFPRENEPIDLIILRIVGGR